VSIEVTDDSLTTTSSPFELLQDELADRGLEPRVLAFEPALA
jgi:hypothetical protein